jgi:hypothetical protein
MARTNVHVEGGTLITKILDDLRQASADCSMILIFVTHNVTLSYVIQEFFELDCTRSLLFTLLLLSIFTNYVLVSFLRARVWLLLLLQVSTALL